MSRIVVALGGNALQSDPKDNSSESQLRTCCKTAKSIADLLEEGNEIVITHGNGPQIGQIISAYETAALADKSKDVMPFQKCGAMSQGYIGYHLQQALKKELKKRGMNNQVATVITQVVVDRDDAAVEEEVIKTLVGAGHIVITVGGGGISVIEKDDGSFE